MKITHLKFTLIFFGIVCIKSTLFAQWSNDVITSHSGSAKLEGSSGHPFVYLNDIVGTTAFSGIMWQETNLQRAFIARDNNLNLLHIGNKSSGSIGDIQINTSGQIGINTAPDASFRMNLSGNAKFEGTDTDGTTGTGSVEITRAGTSRFMVIDDNEIETSGSALFLNHNLANNVYLATGGGNVGIGTTSPTQKLHVEGDIFVQGLIVQPSDIRLKKNIMGLSGGIEIIKRLRPVSFEYREINGLDLKKGNSSRTHSTGSI